MTLRTAALPVGAAFTYSPRPEQTSVDEPTWSSCALKLDWSAMNVWGNPPPSATTGQPVLRDHRLSPGRGPVVRSRPHVAPGDGLILKQHSQGVAVARFEVSCEVLRRRCPLACGERRPSEFGPPGTKRRSGRRGVKQTSRSRMDDSKSPFSAFEDCHPEVGTRATDDRRGRCRCGVELW